MKHIAAIVISLLMLPVASAAQHCLGLTAAARQLSTGALFSRSDGVTSYGAIADANFAGPLSAGMRYIYSGDAPSLSERDVHIVRTRLAYELSRGRFSLCPSLGVDYEDGSISIRNPIEDSEEGPMLHPAWRTLTVPLLMNVGVHLKGPMGLTLVPNVAAGGIWRRFMGRNGAFPSGGSFMDPSASQIAWASRAGLTAAWQRFWIAGTATENTLPESRLEWGVSVGWVIPWELFLRGREPR